MRRRRRKTRKTSYFDLILHCQKNLQFTIPDLTYFIICDVNQSSNENLALCVRATHLKSIVLTSNDNQYRQNIDYRNYIPILEWLSILRIASDPNLMNNSIWLTNIFDASWYDPALIVCVIYCISFIMICKYVFYNICYNKYTIEINLYVASFL